MSREPLVSIGLSVYNGERYLRESFDVSFGSGHAVFEMMISDSGSRDGTEEICREYERRDSRIRYVRHSENRGAAWNSAFVAREARGEYFMWAAHDDLWAPSFIRKCLAMLEAHPEAVLCCTEDTVIDAAGDRIPNWVNYKNIGTLGMTPVERIHALISRVGWFALYGLIRREAVLKISLGLDMLWAEATLLLELLLLGDFVKVDEHLFSTRILERGRPLRTTNGIARSRHRSGRQISRASQPGSCEPFTGPGSRPVRKPRCLLTLSSRSPVQTLTGAR